MKYNVDYFIEKFEAIPEHKWIRGEYGVNGFHCAFGHCGAVHGIHDFSHLPEAEALLSILFNTAMINDGCVEDYPQSTPKKRILAALYDIKSLQAVKEANEIIAEKNSVAFSI